jgi:hydroxymethylpyrimidine/phosphomethylpyrimidine kinase
MKRVLTIAGSDSGGGAGIQADLKAIMAMGCYGASAITALTAQNTLGVQAIYPVSPEFIVSQMESVLEDIGADAIKLGMLFDAPIIKAVAHTLLKYRHIPVVLDPVMISTSGHRLLQEDAIMALREFLFPMATLITPNIHEAIALVGIHGVEESAAQILSMSPKAVLIKGGHCNDEVCKSAKDYLLTRSGGQYFEAPWIETKNTHGTGCTLSAAIAANIAKGFEIESAISNAKTYLTQALKIGSKMQIGHGAGPVCHNWRII